MFCKNCGNRIPDESTFCPFCMNEIEQAREAEPQKNNGKTVLIIIAIVAVLLVAGASVFSVMKGKDGKRPSDNAPSNEQSSDVLTSTSTTTTTTSTTTTTTTQPAAAKDEIYAAYREKINEPYSNAEEYFLYDMDNDGVEELIVRNGTCEADYMFNFYTYDGQLNLLGQESGGHSGLAIPKSGGGLIVYWERQGESCVTQFTKQGKKLIIDRVVSFEYGSYFDLYCSGALAQSTELS